MYLHATPGRKIVLGHSEGAQVEDDRLRRFGPSSDIDPATVTFIGILTGDPETKYTDAPTCPTVVAWPHMAETDFRAIPDTP